MSTTRLVLVRHGEAQSAVEGRVGGRNGCSGLSDLGRRQAEALRDRLAATGELADATALYASTLPRASETAEILAPALGGLDVVVRDDLREFDKGPEADGMTWEEFGRRWPEPERRTPYDNQVPGGETWAAFAARAGAALHDLARDHDGGTVVVACHGGVIETSFTALHGRPLGPGYGSVRIENTGVTEWSWWHEGAPAWVDTATWTLVRHNDHAHLREL